MSLSETTGSEADRPVAVQFVAASRKSREAFNDTALAHSISRLRRDRQITARLTIANTLGLPLVYSHAIDAPDPVDVLVFIHDDV